MPHINLSMFQNRNEITRDEFSLIEKSERYEVYTQAAINKYIEDGSELLEKGENNELTDEGQNKLDIIKSELSSLTRVVVLNNDFSKDVYFVREQGKRPE